MVRLRRGNRNRLMNAIKRRARLRMSVGNASLQHSRLESLFSHNFVVLLGVDSYLEQRLEVCQSSGCLDVRDRRLSIETLNPLFKAVQHCERLRDICLSSIFLADQDFKVCFTFLPALTSSEIKNSIFPHSGVRRPYTDSDCGA